MERLQAQVPTARFVEACSCVGNPVMSRPSVAARAIEPLGQLGCIQLGCILGFSQNSWPHAFKLRRA